MGQTDSKDALDPVVKAEGLNHPPLPSHLPYEILKTVSKDIRDIKSRVEKMEKDVKMLKDHVFGPELHKEDTTETTIGPDHLTDMVERLGQEITFYTAAPSMDQSNVEENDPEPLLESLVETDYGFLRTIMSNLKVKSEQEEEVVLDNGAETMKDYQWETGLGVGTYGAVVGAMNLKRGQKCALKIVSMSHAKEVSKEIKALEVLSHPNVVPCHRAWMDNIDETKLTDLKKLLPSLPETIRLFPGQNFLPIICMEMDLCEGGNLRQFLLAATSVSQDTLSLFFGILKGLLYIHRQQVIHRDLKPENIFVDKSCPSLVKIGDVGLAKLGKWRKTTEEGGDDDNDSGQVSLLFQTFGCGSAGYVAPEQAFSAKYGRSVDIYSLGIILFELLFPPCNQEGPQWGLMWLANVHLGLKQKRQLPVNFPGLPFSKLVLQMTSLDPDLRPTAESIVDRFSSHRCDICKEIIKKVRYRCQGGCQNFDICVTCLEAGNRCPGGLAHLYKLFEDN